MSNTNFPGAIDAPTDPVSSNPLNSPSHAGQHSFENDAIVALETKVGVNSSADTTSMDYKLSGVPSSDKAASKTGTETLTNKTLGTGTSINLGSDATGDMYYRNSGGTLSRVSIGTAGNILANSGGLPTFIPNPAASNGSTTNTGVFQEATQTQVDAGTATGSTGADLVARTDTIRARNINAYVADTGSTNAYAIAPSPVISAYAAGQVFIFKAVNANTGASTLNVNSLGTKSIVKNGSTALASGDIASGQAVTVIYDGTNFQIISPLSSTTTAGSPQGSINTAITSPASTTTGSISFVKLKEFQIITPGSYSVNVAYNGGGATGYVELYKNGSDTGQGTNGASGTFTYTLTGLVAGDLVQIYGKLNTGSYTLTLSNVYIGAFYGPSVTVNL